MLVLNTLILGKHEFYKKTPVTQLEHVNLISFTVDSTSYQAEENMTWGLWVASTYNTGGFIDSGDYIEVGNYWVVVPGQGIFNGDTIIDPNITYTTSELGT